MTHYKIVGGRKIGGNAPGETIEIDDQTHADYLTAAGHIAPVDGPTQKSTKKTATTVAYESEK